MTVDQLARHQRKVGLTDTVRTLRDATETYRRDVREIRINRDLTPEVRARTIADARAILDATVREQQRRFGVLAGDEARSLDSELTSVLDGLSVAPKAQAASQRVGLALEGGTHPAELVSDLLVDRDLEGLAYLRSVIPAVSRRFADEPNEVRGFVDGMRSRIDEALADTADPKSELGRVLRFRSELSDVSQEFEATATYAVKNDTQSLLSMAFAGGS